MASWKDKLRPASFSGVEFGVREHERSGGRRAALHEFPLREAPLVEELGREPRTFLVDGFLVGDDYAARRDRLISLLEDASPDFPESPGRILVLPTVGSLKALCRSYRLRESTDEGRMARFSAEFIEVGEDVQPFAAPNPAGAADSGQEALDAASAAEFTDEVEVEGVVEEVREAITGLVREMTRRLRRLDIFSGPRRDVEALEDLLVQLETQLSVLVTAPADLAGAVQGSLHQVLAAAPTREGALAAYRSLFGLEPSEPLGEGSQAELERANGEATAALIRLSAVANAVRAAARTDFETLEDAREVRDELSVQLDELAAGAAENTLQALEDLRAVLGASVPPPDRELPHLETIRLARTRAALTVAYELYQDAQRGEEIVRRNLLSHPLRIPGLVPLQVLSS